MVIIAVDFDGVLVSDKFPEIGNPDWSMIDAVRDVIDAGHTVILWTSRVHDRLREAYLWCLDEAWLRFSAVNAGAPENLKQYGTDPRKIFADVYIDDRAIGYSRETALNFLRQLAKEEIK